MPGASASGASYNRRPWSDSELELLCAEYATTPVRELVRKLGRSKAVIYNKAAKMGLHRPDPTWSADDDALLSEMYVTKPVDEIAERLGRSREAVQSRVARLKLCRPPEWFDGAEYKRMTSKGRPVLTESEMLEWLTEHVRIDDDGCRIWAGSTLTRDGLPVVMWNRKNYMARRLLVTLSGGTIKGRQLVYDLCGKPRCMNLGCLRVGSKRQMSQALAKRGAFLSGARRSLVSSLSRAKNAKLPITERDTVFRLRGQGETWTAIGRRYGVSGDAVKKATTAWERATGLRLAA